MCDRQRPRYFDGGLRTRVRRGRRGQHFDGSCFERGAHAPTGDPDARAVLQVFGSLTVERDDGPVVEPELAIVEIRVLYPVLDRDRVYGSRQDFKGLGGAGFRGKPVRCCELRRRRERNDQRK